MLSDDSTYSITSQVTDTVTATYNHTLTVTGRIVGVYQCSVSNIRTPSGSSRSLTVVGKKRNVACMLVGRHACIVLSLHCLRVNLSPCHNQVSLSFM